MRHELDPYETGRERFEQLVEYWKQTTDAERNEATTRLQLIDRLFFECLGWNEDDTKVEVAQGLQYSDYEFYVAKRVLIVEAKREGKYFTVPSGKDRLVYSLSSLMRDSENLNEAINQVAEYCQKRGVELGVVCNGHQIVAFVATRNDGISPIDGNAIVFPSLEFMLAHFLELWNLLSKDGVAAKNLKSRLSNEEPVLLPAKLASRIIHYPGNKDRNPFQADLQILSEFILEDLADRDDLGKQFLTECYSHSGALSQYSYVSKQVLRARNEALFDSDPEKPTITPAVTKSGVSQDLLTGTISERPVLLIGDVGVGKTTFLHYLMKIEATTELENAITLYIDLGSEATLTQDLNRYILIETKRQLREDYGIDVDKDDFVRLVYRRDLDGFEQGIYRRLKDADPIEYIKKEINFLALKLDNTDQHIRSVLDFVAKSHRRQVVIFLDNCDQRSEGIQQQAFLVAQELSKQWGAAVFVTLRPETFHNSNKKGALSGYHPKAFSIAPPRVDRVLDLRLQFASKIARGEVSIRTLPNSVGVSLLKLDRIIQILAYSLQKNTEIIEFVDNITSGDIRLALGLVQGFLGSGHVDMQKILDRDAENGPYIIPLHEFLRAVIFGDSEYYNPARSPIVNMFDIASHDPDEHFLLPILISALRLLGEGGQKGFVDTVDLYSYLQGHGFTPNQIDSAIARGIKGHRNKLIDTTAGRIPTPGQDVPPALRATSVGIYHVEKLCGLFTYIDAIVIDTPIFDVQVRQTIKDEHTIEARLKRAVKFQEYLNNCWNNLISSRAGNAKLPFNWETISLSLTADFERALAGHQRNIERESSDRDLEI